LAANAVTTAKITDLNVTTGKLADLSVTTGKLADSAVTEVKIGTGAVTANKIGSGAVTTVKLASSEQMTTANVLNATAAADAGAVGTYAFLRDLTNSNTNINQGATVAGSNLCFSSLSYDSSVLEWGASSGQTPSGTWRLMGFGERAVGSATLRYASLFLRIS